MEDRVCDTMGLQCWHGCWYLADECAGEEGLCLWEYACAKFWSIGAVGGVLRVDGRGSRGTQSDRGVEASKRPKGVVGFIWVETPVGVTLWHASSASLVWLLYCTRTYRLSKTPMVLSLKPL